MSRASSRFRRFSRRTNETLLASLTRLLLLAPPVDRHAPVGVARSITDEARRWSRLLLASARPQAPALSATLRSIARRRSARVSYPRKTHGEAAEPFRILFRPHVSGVRDFTRMLATDARGGRSRNDSKQSASPCTPRDSGGNFENTKLLAGDLDGRRLREQLRHDPRIVELNPAAILGLRIEIAVAAAGGVDQRACRSFVVAALNRRRCGTEHAFGVLRELPKLFRITHPSGKPRLVDEQAPHQARPLDGCGQRDVRAVRPRDDMRRLFQRGEQVPKIVRV